MPALDWPTFATRLPETYPDLTPTEVTALRRQIAALVTARTRWTRLTDPPARQTSRPYRPTSTSKYGDRFTGLGLWWVHPLATGPCPVCHHPLPHLTRKARGIHIYYPFWLKGLRKTWARMRAGLTNKIGAGQIRGHQESVRRRVALFEATAPQAARVLGLGEMTRLVNAFPRCRSNAQWTNWVRIHYGTGRKPWGSNRIGYISKGTGHAHSPHTRNDKG